jgi:hypothetical protein
VSEQADRFQEWLKQQNGSITFQNPNGLGVFEAFYVSPAFVNVRASFVTRRGAAAIGEHVCGAALLALTDGEVSALASMAADFVPTDPAAIEAVRSLRLKISRLF